MPKMTHPDNSRRLDVSPDAVEMYESQGWTQVSAPKKQSEPKPASTATTKE